MGWRTRVGLGLVCFIGCELSDTLWECWSLPHGNPLNVHVLHTYLSMCLVYKCNNTSTLFSLITCRAPLQESVLLTLYMPQEQCMLSHQVKCGTRQYRSLCQPLFAPHQLCGAICGCKVLALLLLALSGIPPYTVGCSTLFARGSCRGLLCGPSTCSPGV